MLNLGTPELLVILVVALLVLGPDKLPDAARQVGKAIGEVRRLGNGFQAEMRDAMREPVKTAPVEPEPPAPDTPSRPSRRAPLRATSAGDEEPTAT